MKAPAPDSERCVAMLARGDRAGTRCTRSGSGSPQLCEQHREAGAVIPDDWTSPDNLPVWHSPRSFPAGPFNPRRFGATLDGSTDDVGAVQAAMYAAEQAATGE